MLLYLVGEGRHWAALSQGSLEGSLPHLLTADSVSMLVFAVTCKRLGYNLSRPELLDIVSH